MKKVVLITGSTRGIGKSIAKYLSDADYHVVINGTDPILSLIHI